MKNIFVISMHGTIMAPYEPILIFGRHVPPLAMLITKIRWSARTSTHIGWNEVNQKNKVVAKISAGVQIMRKEEYLFSVPKILFMYFWACLWSWPRRVQTARPEPGEVERRNRPHTSTTEEFRNNRSKNLSLNIQLRIFRNFHKIALTGLFF